MEDVEEFIFDLAAEFTNKREFEVKGEILLKSVPNYELLLAETEEEFDITLTDEDVLEVQTLQDLIEKVSALVEEKEADERETFSDN